MPHSRPSAKSSSLSTDALDYELPEQLIATQPAEPRDHARLLVVRSSSAAIEHRIVSELPSLLDGEDTLVFNNTAVAPARIAGRRADTGGGVDGLFLHERDDGSWQMMLRSNGRLRRGQRIDLLDTDDQPSGFVLELTERDGSEWRGRIEGRPSTDTVLEAIGRTPLPPYIQRARHAQGIEISDERDRQWYQTTYADPERRRSVAAPTAGLHFTPRLLEAIARRGVRRLDVTLHVGTGTFKPVTAKTIDEHEMHTEFYEVDQATVEALRETRQRIERTGRGRIIAVGTTTVRTLESLPNPLPTQAVGPIAGETDLLIAPPYQFNLVDGMLTNFHLPRSTLLALVAAMVGLERLLAIYREAVEREYRFYSYGDAMLILP
jgi:S-adenosylmethionine:tRNA ribosyltransferase-isomerase